MQLQGGAASVQLHEVIHAHMSTCVKSHSQSTLQAMACYLASSTESVNQRFTLAFTQK